VNLKLFAFWRYDAYPFVLGGEITKMREDGAVEVQGFGSGFWFHPFKIVPLAEGERIKRELESLERALKAEIKKLQVEFLLRRDAVIQVPEEKK
jgi:hypothetical protein